SPMRGQLNYAGGRSLRGEAVDWLHLDYLVAQGPDDSPAADRSARGHSQGTHHFDPIINFELRRAQEFQPARQVIECVGLRGGCEERQRDDAHSLLRVVRAVAEAHPGRAEQLAAAEDDLY